MDVTVVPATSNVACMRRKTTSLLGVLSLETHPALMLQLPVLGKTHGRFNADCSGVPANQLGCFTNVPWTFLMWEVPQGNAPH